MVNQCTATRLAKTETTDDGWISDQYFSLNHKCQTHKYKTLLCYHFKLNFGRQLYGNWNTKV